MELSNDMTKGSINRLIIGFATPLFISNLLQTLYNAVDMAFVGKYIGTEGVSAVSVCGPVMTVMYMSISGLSMGVTILVGFYLGHKDFNRLNRLSGTSIIFYFILSIILTLLGFIFTPYILNAINTPREAYSLALGYMRIIIFGLIFTFGYNLICALQRGFGDSKSSLYFVIVATIANIALDYILIKIMGLGVYGAAIATVASQGISFIMGIVYFKIKKHIVTFNPKSLIFDKACIKEILIIGLPNAIQQSVVNFSGVVLGGIVNDFGVIASAAYGIGVKIDSFSVQPTNAISSAVAAMTSQNLGGGEEKRAIDCVYKAQRLTLIFNGILTLLVFIFASQIAGFFDKNPEVIIKASSFMKISVIMYLFHAFIEPRSGFVRGTGNTTFPLLNSLISQYAIRIPIGFILSKVFNLGINGIAISVISAPMFSGITYGIYFKKELWRKKYNKQHIV